MATIQTGCALSEKNLADMMWHNIFQQYLPQSGLSRDCLCTEFRISHSSICTVIQQMLKLFDRYWDDMFSVLASNNVHSSPSFSLHVNVTSQQFLPH